jgi:hypothetical protein
VPVGKTSRLRPPPSSILYFLTFGFALSISLMVSAMVSLQNGVIFVPQTLVHRTPNCSPIKLVAAAARPRTSSHLFSRKLFKHNNILACEDVGGGTRKCAFDEFWLPPRDSNPD